MGKLVALVLGLAALALLAVGLSIAIVIGLSIASALLVRLSGWLWSKVCR